jgi:hypothetical protein
VSTASGWVQRFLGGMHGWRKCCAYEMNGMYMHGVCGRVLVLPVCSFFISNLPGHISSTSTVLTLPNMSTFWTEAVLSKRDFAAQDFKMVITRLENTKARRSISRNSNRHSLKATNSNNMGDIKTNSDSID